MNGNRRLGSSRFGEIPVKEGEEYDVEIEGIGEKGDGIAKIKGYVIIVPGVNKGDKVRVRVNAVRGKVSFGEVIGGQSEDAAETGEEQEEKTQASDSDDEGEMEGESPEDEEGEEEDEGKKE